jgi:single-strand DNA-binding protein
VNRVHLSGNLGEKPVVTATSGGTFVTKLSLATTERRKKGDKWEDHTEWHRVVVWGNRAKTCERLDKGSQVIIEGRLQTTKWTDKAGVDRWTTEVIADQVEFGARVKPNRPPDPGYEGGNESGGGEQSSGGGGDGGFDADSDIPF